MILAFLASTDTKVLASTHARLMISFFTPLPQQQPGKPDPARQDSANGSPFMGGAALHAALVLTRSGRCLVYCAAGSYSQNPILRTGPLAQLLTTMQDLAGHPHGSQYIELQGVGIVLLEGYHVIVGVLCDPGSENVVDAARLVGMQALNIFGKLYHSQVQKLDEEHVAESTAAINSYTVHSATQNIGDGVDATDAALTHPSFTAFRQGVLQPLLLREPPGETWLQPLLRCGQSLRAFLVNPAPLRAQEWVLLHTPPRADRPLAHCAGPHAAAAWHDVLYHAKTALAAHPADRSAATDRQNRRSPLAVIAFPEMKLGGVCLHAAIRPVRIMPAGGCLVLFYESPVPNAKPSDASLGGRGGASRRVSALRGAPADNVAVDVGAASITLTDHALPQELKVALHSAAKRISAAFPTAVTSLPNLHNVASDAPEDLPSTSPDEHEVRTPSTPVRLVRAAPEKPSKETSEEDEEALDLDIETPRGGGVAEEAAAADRRGRKAVRKLPTGDAYAAH